MRENEMKRTRKMLAALLILCFLLTGCQSAQKAAPAAEPDSAAQPQSPAPVAAAEPQEDDGKKEMYAAYLDLLTANREDILGYDWQKGMVFDEALYQTRPVDVAAPVVLADVWGDETPELLFLAAEEYEGYRVFARLHIVAFEDGEAREIANEDLDLTFDGQVGGGSNYRLFQTGEDKGLWLYEVYYSEGCEEKYTHLTAEGELKEQFDCSHSSYPMENDAGEWVTEDAWGVGSKDCSQAEYEAVVPAPAEQAKGLLMRNAMGYEYDDELEKPEGAYDYPDGAAMTYDAAAAYLRGELGITFDENVDEAEFFASLPTGYEFLSGVGGWASELFLNPDGTFTGDYHDSDMGDDGEGYPNGTIYVCAFSGRFGNVKRVDEYTYSMHLVELNIEETPAEEWIEDGVRYVASGPYGLENADEILVYLPGSWVRSLPYGFVSWVAMPRAWGWNGEPDPVLLPFCGLYNVADEEGWSSYEIVPDTLINVDWADDAATDATDYDVFTMESGDPQARVLFTAQDTVTEFEVLALSVKDVSQSGEMTFDVREVYEQEKLAPDKALVVETVFHGDSPCLGFAYVDGAGVQHRCAVDVSGMDGSLYFWEF